MIMMMKGSKVIHILFYFIGLYCMKITLICAVPCMDSEQQALLLKLKEGFKSASDSLSSWTAKEDCCKWRGVGCDNATGHVTILDLHSQDPFNILQGTVSNNLGNLSHLESLDLTGNGFSLRVENLNWLYHLSSLKVLNLGGVDLSNAEGWLDAVNMLPSLVELRLFFCKLHKLPQNLHHVNFTSLKFLDLSYNNFSSTIPDWLSEIGHSVVYLNLSRCQLQSMIPDAFGNLTSLISLDLSENNLEGPIPLTLSLFNKSSSLRELYLSNNRLNGSLVQSLAQLSQLVALDVAGNDLEGNITEAHLIKFSSLQVLVLSSNRLVLNVSSSWIPPFQLETLDLRSCLVGPKFPHWLRSQKNLSSIDISNATIADVVPDWFWNFSSKPNLGSIYTIVFIVIVSSNNLTGKIPAEVMSLVGLISLNFSRNHLVGPIPPNIGEMISLEILELSRNHLSCTIPASMTNMSILADFNMSHNNLSGEIPRGTQLEIFDSSSYIENPQLCGSPLSKICSIDESFGDPHCNNENGDKENQGIQEEEQDGFEIPSFYLSMGLGFIIGFSVFWGSLLLNRSWRHTYIRFLDNMSNQIAKEVSKPTTS
uniref:Leucine-rich repeat-containing N-terminal plant-type domain-containing protein n=1 Tax=Fagus sylvatica TaxID=28930 RepID=A0A2N9I8F2_FAGSY